MGVRIWTATSSHWHGKHAASPQVLLWVLWRNFWIFSFILHMVSLISTERNNIHFELWLERIELCPQSKARLWDWKVPVSPRDKTVNWSTLMATCASAHSFRLIAPLQIHSYKCYRPRSLQVQVCNSIKAGGWRDARQLEYWLLFQRIRVLLSAPTEWLTTVSNSRSRGIQRSLLASVGTAHAWSTDIHAGTTPHQISNENWIKVASVTCLTATQWRKWEQSILM